MNEQTITLERAIQREAQLLRDIATFCAAQALLATREEREAYYYVRDHCLRLADTRRP